MPSSHKIKKEIEDYLGKNPKEDPFHYIRKKYLGKLFEKRGRNIISYYSGWLQKPPPQGRSIRRDSEINDKDKNSFMETIHELKREQGLDLIIHTPGGEVAATESIVYYLKTMFNNDIEVFVPQIAMSAGTMIACASKNIYMGKHSNLGPIDPQIGGGISAPAIIEEFERAKKEITENPAVLPLWHAIINQYHPTLLLSCENADKWSQEIVENWLRDNMFKESDNKLIKSIVKKLSNHKEMKSHSRHISIEEAERIGLKITSLEKDQELQDIVLSIHHSYIHTLRSTNILKIVENHKGIGEAVYTPR